MELRKAFSHMLTCRVPRQSVTTTLDDWTPPPAASSSTTDSGNGSDTHRRFMPKGAQHAQVEWRCDRHHTFDTAHERPGRGTHALPLWHVVQALELQLGLQAVTIA